MSEVQLRFRMWMILVPLIVIELNSSFEYRMLVTSVPAIGRSFDSFIGVGWITASNALVAAATAIAQFGSFIVYAAIPNLVAKNVSPDQTAEATGIASVFRAVVQALGSVVVMAASLEGHGIGRRWPSLSRGRCVRSRLCLSVGDQCGGLARACAGMAGYAARGGHGRPGLVVRSPMIPREPAFAPLSVFTCWESNHV